MGKVRAGLPPAVQRLGVMRTIQGSKEKKVGAVFPGLPASGQAGEIDEKAVCLAP